MIILTSYFQTDLESDGKLATDVIENYYITNAASLA